jgi:RNA polymerase sigma-70 factor (ECF subfamily)
VNHRESEDTAAFKEGESEAQAALLQLVLRAQAGEERAQEELIAAYQRRLGGFIYGMIPDPSQVDDLCQAVFVKMVLALPQLRDPERFEAWLFKMARNRCLSHLRREKFRRLFSPLSDDHHEVAAPPAAEAGADLLLLRAALREMPERERALLLQVQDRESDYRRLAAGMGIGVGALKTRVHRAKQALKERIEYVRRRNSLE